MVVLLGLGAAGCAGKKVNRPTTLSQLKGKRVALAEIQGGKESKTHLEVAVVNEIIERGHFEIIDRTTVEEALVSYPTESDWQQLGRKLDADYILAVRARDFDVKERQGYDKVEEEDSVLTEELGADDPVVATRYVKVKSYEGRVAVEGRFYDVAADRVSYEGVGRATETVNSKTGKAFPGKLQLLEKLSAQAVQDFFRTMPK